MNLQMLARSRARDRQLVQTAGFMREIYSLQCAGSRLLLLQCCWCCWCEYWRVMAAVHGRQTPYIHTIPILHVIIINVSPKLGIAAVTSSYLQTKQSSSAHTAHAAGQPPHTLAWPVPAPGDTRTRDTVSDHLYCFILLPSHITLF